MEVKTNSRNFRENLSNFFDKAVEEPIAINRGTERFVLMSESEFLKLQQEIFNLQRSLISSLQIQNGDGGIEEDLDLNENNDPLLEEYIAKFQHAKKQSKVG
jgi:PHD/YefM family antitoxin component YafN of YafNO toxin-antitoxin module